jgi:hypothetical protein
LPLTGRKMATTCEGQACSPITGIGTRVNPAGGSPPEAAVGEDSAGIGRPFRLAHPSSLPAWVNASSGK